MKKLLFAFFLSSLLIMGMFLNSQAKVAFGVRTLSFHNSIIPMDQSFGSYFGLNAGTSVVILAGVDYGRLGVTIESSGMGFSEKDEFSASYLMPHGGIKFYLKPKAKGDVVPYLLADVFKSFASVDLGDEDELEDQAEDLLSPFGLNPAFGAEYCASDNFTVGGELGVRLSFTSTESKNGTTTKLSLSRYFIYSGFTLNFDL